MEKEFNKFCSDIKLTSKQRTDAKLKYRGVAKKLHDKYYETEYNGDTKFLFGSYKTKTNTRPITEKHDVDLLFKIPDETFQKFDDYEGNGQSALLQEIKTVLNEKYTTTDKIRAWGKVVLVTFADGTHNVEVLPAYEQDDGTFLIPNSENGGSWDSFDPRSQVVKFQISNDKTDGLTGDLTRMIKTWKRNITTLNYGSYKIIDDVINFLDSEFENGVDYDEYQNVVLNFFDYLKRNCVSEIKNHSVTAYNRAAKAIEYYDNDKPKEASEEWRKIFGDLFPLVTVNPVKTNVVKPRGIVAPSSPWRKF